MPNISRETALETLTGGLWHTTHPDRFEMIIETGAIMPEPIGVPDEERWGTSQGPELYPYVRTLGGISLFDFQNFSYRAYDKRCPNSNWREFVPFREIWGCAVWIEIDRTKAAENLISSRGIRDRQERENAHRHRIMPHIEAAYIGDLPRAAFVRALLISEGDEKFSDISEKLKSD